MNPVTLSAFLDEVGLIKEAGGIIQNVGNRIAQTMSKGWNHSSMAWGGQGFVRGASRGMVGNAVEHVTSLGGATKYLPVGGKSMTVGMGALGVPGAIAKEDPSGQGRSRTERLGGLAANTAAGVALAPAGLVTQIAGGLGADVAGSSIGRAISGRKKKKVTDSVTPGLVSHAQDSVKAVS
jgi:hypothetical protein